MNFQFAHYNYNVKNLETSIQFYEKALGLKEVRRKEAKDGSFILVYLGDGKTAVSYTHLTLPTKYNSCRSRWSPYH